MELFIIIFLDLLFSLHDGFLFYSFLFPVTRVNLVCIPESLLAAGMGVVLSTPL